MSSQRDRYRNPPAPLDYIKKTPELVAKESINNEENSEIFRLIDMLIDSGICDEPDVSIYEHFTINTSSEEEDISSAEKEPTSPGTPKDIIKDKNSAPEHKKVIKLESGCHTNESCTEEKTPIKLDEVIKRKKHSKKVTSNNHSDRKRYKKSDYKRDSDTSEIYIKIEGYSSGGDCPSTKPFKRTVIYSSDGESHSKSHHEKKDCYKSDSYSRSRHEKRISDLSDNDSRSRSRHKKRNSYSSDSDSHSRSRRKKRNSYSSDSDSHNKRHHKKKNKYKSNPHKKLERNDSDNKLLCKTSELEAFSIKKEDSDSNSYKTSGKSDYTIVRMDGKHQTSACPSTQNEEKKFKPADTQNEEKKFKPADTQNEEKKFKPADEDMEDSDFLFGHYRCNICKITVNSLSIYKSHINGKKHKKAVENLHNNKQTGTPVLIPLTPVLPPVQSKYPLPPPGYRRIKMECVSLIQSFLETNDKLPYPGLDKVTEIRSAHETSYYCSFCDSHCSHNSIMPHLNGFKHQLCSLKYYRNDLYQSWCYKPKYQIEQDVRSVLRIEEKKHGKGLMKVEKDVKETDIGDSKFEKTTRKDPSEPSTSTQFQDFDLTDSFKYNSLPDPTKSGYFCKICQSHCNSEAMWQAHIVGKRHISNLKKNPGAAPSKCKYIIAAGNVRPYLFDILIRNNVDSPVIGLSQIREIRKPEVDGVMFQCFLCGGSLTCMEIVNHVLSSKHREKYLANINHPQLEMLANCAVSETCRASLLEDIAAEVEADEGRGTPDVCYSKC